MIMSYTVGLDFGTHQTKVCIEDASNPAQKIYEFFEFEDSDGGKSVLFPSIVQINADDTVSYGFVDEKRCKEMSYSSSPKPILELPEEPVLELPPRPEKLPYPPKPKKLDKKGYSLKDQLAYIKRYDEDCILWKLQCKQIDEDYCKKLEEWDLECCAIKNDIEYDLKEYESEKQRKQNDFEKALRLWEKESIPVKQIFRYFKLAAFSNYSWSHQINPRIISVWYLTYILFKIQEKLGNNFYTQMGVSYSIDQYVASKQKDIAFRILLAANYLLVEYKSLDRFLNVKYTELIENTELLDYTEEDKVSYGINVLPEAFAGLSSITQQGKLTRGMHLLADIGGGTTDIAFFTITENRMPNIHAVISFPYGLNYIFEEYIKVNNTFTIEDIQNLFRKTQKGFNSSVAMYHSHLKDKTNRMIKRIEKEFLCRQPIHGLHIQRLRNALSKRPVLYCGGGSIYQNMRIPVPFFEDIRVINKDLLSIPYIKNRHIDNSLYTILATSFGLSIPLESEIIMTPIENVFDHLPEVDNDSSDWRGEHGLADT